MMRATDSWERSIGREAGKQEFFAEVFATYVKDGHAAVASEYVPALADFYRDVVMTATR